MKNELKLLVIKLKEENQTRSTYLSMDIISQYSRIAYQHAYNNTLTIINKLEAIINKY